MDADVLRRWSQSRSRRWSHGLSHRSSHRFSHRFPDARFSPQ
jgi:hypothetical protein